MRILIVDDEASVRTYLDVLLTRRGFTTLAASSAAHADALLLDFPQEPDLALVDLWLRAGIDGPTYVDSLIARFPRVRVIFITGWREPGPELHRAHARGRVLFKPFTSQQLLDAVHVSTDHL